MKMRGNFLIKLCIYSTWSFYLPESNLLFGRFLVLLDFIQIPMAIAMVESLYVEKILLRSENRRGNL